MLIMSYRVQKPAKNSDSRKRKKVDKSVALAASILSHSSEMKPCYSCEKKGTQCLASERDSTRCSECVKDHKSHCEAFLSSQQLLRISRRRDQLDSEVEAAEEEAMRLMAKIARLRKQRKDWKEKAARAISRGIEDLEELDRVEREEREAEAARQAALSAPNCVAGPSQSVDAVDWSEFELDPSLFPPLATDEIPAGSSGRSS